MVNFHSQPGYTVFRHNPPGSFPYYHLYADEHRDPRCHMLKMDQTQDGSLSHFPEGSSHREGYPLCTLVRNTFVFCFNHHNIFSLYNIASSCHQIYTFFSNFKTSEVRIYHTIKSVLKLFGNISFVIVKYC